MPITPEEIQAGEILINIVAAMFQKAYAARQLARVIGADPVKIEAAIAAARAEFEGIDVDPLGRIGTDGKPIAGPGPVTVPPATTDDPTTETFTIQPPHIDGYSIYQTPAGAFRYYPHSFPGVDPTWTLVEN